MPTHSVYIFALRVWQPHMHMVIRLLDGPRSSEQYDRYVTARLPPGPPRKCNEPGCICRNGREVNECGCGLEVCECDDVYWHAVLKQMVHVCSDDAPCRDSTTGRRALLDPDLALPYKLYSKYKLLGGRELWLQTVYVKSLSSLYRRLRYCITLA